MNAGRSRLQRRRGREGANKRKRERETPRRYRGDGRERWRVRSKPDEQTQSGKSRWRGSLGFLCARLRAPTHTQSPRGRDETGEPWRRKRDPDELEGKEESKDDARRDG